MIVNRKIIPQVMVLSLDFLKQFLFDECIILFALLYIL